MTIDQKDFNRISALVGIFTILAAATTLALYLDRRKHRKLQAEILVLDKSIKELQYEKLKNNN